MTQFFDCTPSSIVDFTSESSEESVASVQKEDAEAMKPFASYSYESSFLYDPLMEPIEFNAFLNSNV